MLTYASVCLYTDISGDSVLAKFNAVWLSGYRDASGNAPVPDIYDTKYSSSHYYILHTYYYMCPHTTHTTICVLILRYMCTYA
jgi:hypothetical protein